MKKKYLTYKEIMQALLNGEKITSASWGDGQYIYFGDNGSLFAGDGCELEFDDVEFFDNMYIYEEPKEKVELFIWALANNKDCYYSICTNFMTEEEAKFNYGENIIKTNVSIVVDKD